MRRVAELFSVHDVLGLLGLAGLAWAAYTVDYRLSIAVVSVALILLAVAYARPPARRE